MSALPRFPRFMLLLAQLLHYCVFAALQRTGLQTTPCLAHAPFPTSCASCSCWVSCFATVFLLYRPGQNPTCVQDSATWAQVGQVRLFWGSPGRSWAQPGPILRTQRPTLRTCSLLAISNIFALCWVSCQPMLPTLVLSCAPYTGTLRPQHAQPS